MSRSATNGARPVLAMSSLGAAGRFANQLFQYAFLRILAHRHGLRVQTSPWVGQKLFGHRDEAVAREYPLVVEQGYDAGSSQLAPAQQLEGNIDIAGFFQFHTSWYAPHKEYFRSLFGPVAQIEALLRAAVDRLRTSTKTQIIALHLRRGDYGYGCFFPAPTSWYLSWLEELWPQLADPVLYIASDEPEKVVADFREYGPLTASDLGVSIPGAEFYPDFYLLSQCDIAAISNSSFSFAACMLNDRARLFLRPHLFEQRLIAFDPWNSEPLLHRELGIINPRRVVDAAAAFIQQPSDPARQEELQGMRAEVARTLLEVPADELRMALSMGLSRCIGTLFNPAVRAAPIGPAETALASRALALAQQSADAGQQLKGIAACMLYHSPDILGPRPDASQVPQWFRAGYLRYVDG